jgi:hypothetical protein
MKFYLALAHHIPRIEAFVHADTVREWIYAVIDSVWRFLSHGEGRKKPTPGIQFANLQSILMMHMLRLFTSAMFAQFSNEVYHDAIQRIADLIRDDVSFLFHD